MSSTRRSKLHHYYHFRSWQELLVVGRHQVSMSMWMNLRLSARLWRAVVLSRLAD